VLAQGDPANPSAFNLLVVYSPTSGGVGLSTPVVVEQFNGVTLDTVTSLFTSSAQLISAESFSGEPNPSLSAYDLMHYDANQAVPSITLTGTLNSNVTTWTPQPDLLADSATDTDFVVEIESDGTAFLRFGDNTNGMLPQSGTAFTASYRIGNGTAGNVGANSLTFLVADPRIVACTNPLPATGGIDPETMAQIRRRAPQAFMTQERAVTMADYETVAEMNTQVENAVATLRWTGSWFTVFITAEPEGGGSLTPSLAKAIRQNVNRYRLAGQDIQLESPQYVPLQIALTICVDPDYFQSNVRQGLMQVLGSQVLPNGQKGLFYPDNFTFGQTVYLSPIYAAARQVAGVLSVNATVFAPQGVTTKLYLAKGEIPLGPFQIARMDNDPSFPNHGQLTLNLVGGK
jgi:predicted phage baseplate assembly protein